LIGMILLSVYTAAQEIPVRLPGRTGAPGGLPGRRMPGGAQGAAGGVDSLEHRDQYEDSITISFQFPVSVQFNKLDSSVVDYTRRFPIPADHVFLGNTGTASHSLFFSPILKSGWDQGMHAFDIYSFRPESARFFKTTRPYTELGYLLGGRTEQIIEITHTQNIKPNWNAMFQYRLINSPGFFKNQRTNHNNYLFTSWYQSVNKRYNNYITLTANKLLSEENGGISSDEDYLNDPVYKDRFQIPVNLGGDPAFSRNFFSASYNTGNKYNSFNLSIRQQYDLGQKDSIVTDSTVIPLFYPRLRFEHIFSVAKYAFHYTDNLADSLYYADHYGIVLPGPFDTVNIEDSWNEIVNDFSIYQFPDARNQLQFFKAGLFIQQLKAATPLYSGSFYNIAAHGEYRNKTRNKKWDMSASGRLYLNGFNSGDYDAAVSLKRFSGKQNAFIELNFKNVNRTPSFLFDNRSGFHLDMPASLKKENITYLNGSFYQPGLQFKMTFHYYLVSNYTYLRDFYRISQQSALFNVLKIDLSKKISISPRFVWYADLYFQKKTGDAPLNIPLFFSRNRIGYEGSFGFKNLNIFLGAEIRYHSPYKADGYSPVEGNFYFQDSLTITNRPDIAGFMHFRIRNFRLFFRAENLNTASFKDGFGFTHNNFAAADYPYPGMNMRLGIYWTFVN